MQGRIKFRNFLFFTARIFNYIMAFFFSSASECPSRTLTPTPLAHRPVFHDRVLLNVESDARTRVCHRRRCLDQLYVFGIDWCLCSCRYCVAWWACCYFVLTVLVYGCLLFYHISPFVAYTANKYQHSTEQNIFGESGGVYKSRTGHLNFIFVLIGSSSEDRQVTMSDHGEKINVFPAAPVAILWL